MSGKVSEEKKGTHVTEHINCPVQDYTHTDGDQWLQQGGRGTGQEKDRERKKHERWKEKMMRPECSDGKSPEPQPLPVETKPPSVVRD